MPKTIAVLRGSPRAGSLTEKLATAIAQAAGDRLAFRDVPVHGLPFYNPDQDGDDRPVEWTAFRDAVRSADGLLFVSPEWNRSVPGGLKNAIDIGSRPYGKGVFAQKPTAVVTQSTGGTGGFGWEKKEKEVREAAAAKKEAAEAKEKAKLAAESRAKKGKKDVRKGPVDLSDIPAKKWERTDDGRSFRYCTWAAYDAAGFELLVMVKTGEFDAKGEPILEKRVQKFHNAFCGIPTDGGYCSQHKAVKKRGYPQKAKQVAHAIMNNDESDESDESDEEETAPAVVSVTLDGK